MRLEGVTVLVLMSPSEYSSPLLHLCAVFSLSKHLLSFRDCLRVSANVVVSQPVAKHFVAN